MPTAWQWTLWSGTTTTQRFSSPAVQTGLWRSGTTPSSKKNHQELRADAVNKTFSFWILHVHHGKNSIIWFCGCLLNFCHQHYCVFVHHCKWLPVDFQLQHCWLNWVPLGIVTAGFWKAVEGSCTWQRHNHRWESKFQYGVKSASLGLHICWTWQLWK